MKKPIKKKPTVAKAKSKTIKNETIATKVKPKIEKNKPVVAKVEKNRPIAVKVKSKATKQNKKFQTIYKEAVTLFRNKNYKESLKLFDVLFDTKSDDPGINFYMGRNYFELKDYDNALGAYERVLIVSPDSIRTKLEVARCYFLLGMYPESKTLFTEIEKSEIPQSVRKNVQKYLSILEQKLKKHIFGGIFIVGAAYESNINNRADSSNFYIPKYANINNGIFDNSTVDENDMAHQEILLMNHSYILSDTRTLKNDVMMFAKTYKDNSSKNIRLISYSPTYAITHWEKLQVDYSIFYDTLWYGSKHLLSTHGIYPKLKYKLDANKEIGSYFKYQVKRNEQKANENKDSSVKELSLNLKQTLDTKNILMPSITYSTERKKRGELTNVNNDSFSYDLAFTNIYTKKISFSPKFTYKTTNYKQNDTMYLKKQKDKQYQCSFTSTYLHDKGFIVQNVLNYTKNDSNIVSSEYDKYSITFNFIKQF